MANFLIILALMWVSSGVGVVLVFLWRGLEILLKIKKKQNPDIALMATIIVFILFKIITKPNNDLSHNVSVIAGAIIGSFFSMFLIYKNKK